MIRGTTPDYILTIDADLTGMTVFVTIRQRDTEVTLTGDQLSVACGESESVVAFRLTQEQTLGLTVGKAEVQIRFIDADGKAFASEIATITVKRILLERVIAYDEVPDHGN